MIDIHSHIIPGVDDGSPNLKETEKLLKMSWNQGVTDLIAIPHFSRNLAPERLADCFEKVCFHGGGCSYQSDFFVSSPYRLGAGSLHDADKWNGRCFLQLVKHQMPRIAGQRAHLCPRRSQIADARQQIGSHPSVSPSLLMRMTSKQLRLSMVIGGR